MKRSSLNVFGLAIAIGGGVFLGEPAHAESDKPVFDQRTVYFDYLDADGNLAGEKTSVPAETFTLGATAPADVVTAVGDSLNTSNRLDVVFVGDGYIASEMPLFHQHCDYVIGELFAEEPYASYANFFNVHKVEVVSAESGVSGDPTGDVYRNTALHMCYVGGGRGLAVDVGLALSYASNAPDVDSVVAVANSTKYGGGGYPDPGVATAAGDNYWTSELVLHEFGHSMGKLADEYTYGSEDPYYTGPEPVERNVSTLDYAAMQASGLKWAPWLGDNFRYFGGVQTTVEGARYCAYDIYRPTQSSKMGGLGAPFNMPSVESIIIELYKIVSPIDDYTPASAAAQSTDVLSVTPLHPVDHALDIQWRLDGEIIPGATGESLDLSQFVLYGYNHRITAEVVDNTWMVRDEVARSDWMTASHTWTVTAPCDRGDLNCDGAVNAFDIDPFVLVLTNSRQYRHDYPNCSEDLADCNADGAVNAFDVDPFVILLVGG